MAKYIVKRALIGVVTLFALATITFFMMHIIPGSPFAGETSRLPASVRETLIKGYGLDQPLTTQFATYLENVLHGDFGTSLNRKGKEVVDIIADGLPATASLGLVAFCVALSVGVLLGTVAAFSKQKWVSGAVAFLSTFGVSVPSFLLALLMMLVFGVLLGWLPIVGLGSWRHYIMPSIALALSPIAMITRLVRTSLMEVMRQDYMVLARSKGTSELKVIIRHALKNALVPVITYAGPLVATLLTGSFVVETLFSVPGIGAEFVNSVSNRDYTLIMALTIFYGVVHHRRQPRHRPDHGRDGPAHPTEVRKERRRMDAEQKQREFPAGRRRRSRLLRLRRSRTSCSSRWTSSEKDSEFVAMESKTYLQDAWSRFRKNKLALVGLVFICAMILAAIFVPIFSPYTYDGQDLTE